MGIKLNKKVRVLAIVLLLFSWCTGLLLRMTEVHASDGKHKMELYDQDGVKISYSYQVEEDESHNVWKLKLDRKTTKENRLQRFQVKITDSDHKPIDYSEIEGIDVQGEWLIEKNYSASDERELSVKLPKTIVELLLTVQLDEKGLADEDTATKMILPENVSCKLTMDKPQENVPRAPANEKENEQEELFGPALENSRTNGADLRLGDSGLAQNLRMYTNKEPEYTDDPQKGKYPTQAWIPDGSENVLNHQGGVENRIGWDGNTAWNTSGTNLTSSYIHYGYNADVADKASLSIRKMAMPTDKEDEFKVRLNVRGQTNFEPGLDVVLLLDNSKSLNTTFSKGKALNMVTELVKALTTLKDVDKANIRLGAHVFSSYDSTGIATIPISDNSTNWKKIYGNTGYGKSPDGATHTQRGVIEANDLFIQAKQTDEAAGKTYNRKKMMMIFTDGAPNESWKPIQAVSDTTMYYDKVFVTKSDDKNTDGSYKMGQRLGATNTRTKFSSPQNYGGQSISSHLTMANSAAREVKEQGVEIHTIAVDINPVAQEGHSRQELLQGLYRMASRKANATGALNNQGDYFFQNGSISDLEKYITEWYVEIARSVQKGQINDPLGDMVDLVGTPKITQVAGEATTIPPVQKKDNDRRLYVDNLNLYKGQEVQIEYIVKLRTDDPSYVPGKWYPTNGQTTLTPTPERSPDVLDFAVPSVRLKDNTPSLEVSVEKSWEDSHQSQQDFWGLRPKKITAVLQRKEGSVWRNIQELEVTQANDWKAIFDAVDGDETEYRVIEKNRVSGYAEALYNPTTFNEATLGIDGVKIINRLLTTDYTFKKVSHDGQTPFTGTDVPKFKVTRQAKGTLPAVEVIVDLTPAADGTVKVEKLPIGSYLVEETHVPAGHSKMTDFVIDVVEKNDGTAIEAKVSEQETPHVVSNKLNDFKLIVLKVDEENNALNGASFKLTGPNSYDQTISTGSTFTFTGLKPGTYTLKELSSPQGYMGLKDEITITIELDGTISIPQHPLLSEDYSLADNRIELTVKNKRMEGVLPSTGGGGLHARSIMFIACLLIGGTLAGYLLVSEKRRYQRTKE